MRLAACIVAPERKVVAFEFLPGLFSKSWLISRGSAFGVAKAQDSN